MTINCSVTDLVSLFQCVNNYFPFGMAISLGIFLIAFFAFKSGASFSKSLFPAAFISTITAGVFFLLNMLPDYALYFAIVVTGLSGAILYLRD